MQVSPDMMVAIAFASAYAVVSNFMFFYVLKQRPIKEVIPFTVLSTLLTAYLTIIPLYYLCRIFFESKILSGILPCLILNFTPLGAVASLIGAFLLFPLFSFLTERKLRREMSSADQPSAPFPENSIDESEGPLQKLDDAEFRAAIREGVRLAEQDAELLLLHKNSQVFGLDETLAMLCAKKEKELANRKDLSHQEVKAIVDAEVSQARNYLENYMATEWVK